MLKKPATRLGRLAALVAAGLTCAGCGSAAPPSHEAVSGGLGDAGYFAVADRLQVHLDALWNEHLQRYEPPGLSGAVTQVNANLLLVHAVAALRGHTGPARNDRRARLVARFLTGPLTWTEHPLPGAPPWVEGPGWRAAPNNPNQHLVFAAEAADGLVGAYIARRRLGLGTAIVAAIRDQIARTAASPDFRWPALRLNQFNWAGAIFAADAIVNGATRTLADGMGRHVDRFLGGLPGGRGPMRNFGPGLRFHYLPARDLRLAANFDSPEYANIVLSFSRFYGLARASGMLAPAGLGRLRAWVRRAVAGYWTHAGYLNWDTGLGFGRWHQSKKLPLAHGALIGIASQPELQPSPDWGAWAKWILDRGLLAYAGEADRDGRIPPSVAYGLRVVHQSRANAYLAASRHAANAMRAVTAGLGDAPAGEPPALYAYDPDTGRLAVTTPAYNTAIVAVNQGAFPYGGLDLARLFNGRQEVAAGVGGVPPAAFGLEVVGGDGRVRVRTQYGRRLRATGPVPLRLIRAPLGARATAGLEPYAGPFTDLRVRGSVRRAGLRATSEYRFTPAFVEGRWTVAGSRRPGDEVRVSFPSWGRAARVWATLRDGRRVAVGRHGPALAEVATMHVVSRHSGYRITPLTRPPGARLRLVATSPVPSAPDPGPTLAVVLLERSFSARIVVDEP